MTKNGINEHTCVDLAHHTDTRELLSLGFDVA
jgi:hypothetical protein